MPVKWQKLGAVLILWILSVSAIKNDITDVRTTCEEPFMNVTLQFKSPFSGIIYSKGSDCLMSRSHHQESVVVSLDPRHCFLKVSKENGVLWYSGSLQVQMSDSVQQVTDPIVPIKCSLDTDSLTLKVKTRRSGRKIDGGDELAPGKAWLEVRGSAISTFIPTTSLSVGEHTTLSVYTALPEGISGRPVECKVDDGRGGSQTLTDDRGCSTDSGLVPALRLVGEGHWATAFPAFSFPDTHLVHYTCLLMICSGECPQYDCSDDGNSSRNSRDYQEESIMDMVELYNSVEVTAPNIELSYLRKDILEQPQTGIDENWVCLSGPRVALVFATLGALFLAAVLVTLLLLIRHRRRYIRRHPYGLYS